MKELKKLLEIEISSPFEMAKDFHEIGLLSWESYIAFKYYSINFLDYTEAQYSLANLILDKLFHRTKLDSFKEFLRITLPMSYEVLSSMGEY